MIISTLGLSFPLFTSASERLSSNEFTRSGLYAGAGGIYALETFQNTHGLHFTNSPGYNIRIGYRLNPEAAVELGGERIEEFRIKNSNDGVQTWATTLNGKIYFLDGRVQPFLLAGVGLLYAKTGSQSLKSDSREISGVFRGGVGLDCYITRHWLINWEINGILPRFVNFNGSTEFGYVALGAGVQLRW